MTRSWVDRLAVATIAMTSSPAFAEISDKVPTVEGMWSTALVIVILAGVCGRKLPSMALLPLPVSALLAYGTWELLSDPSFFSAIREELGGRYIAHSYATAAVSLIGPLAMFAGWRIAGRHRDAGR